MVDYVEDPIDRIVDVHWKKKDDDPDEQPPECGPPYCGHYGAGYQYGDPISTAAAHGPHQYPPTVGTYWTKQDNISGEEEYGRVYSVSGFVSTLPPTLTASPGGFIAFFIYMDVRDLYFTNFDLSNREDDIGIPLLWRVPMVHGCGSDGIPLVVNKYHISIDWHHHEDDEGDRKLESGIAFSHPVNGSVGGSNRPPTAYINYGVLVDGSITFEYAFHPEINWASFDSGGFNTFFNSSNCFDPTTGGPALIWWMTRDVSGGTPRQWLHSQVLGEPMRPEVGDFAHWHIQAECTRMPDYHPSMARALLGPRRTPSFQTPVFRRR